MGVFRSRDGVHDNRGWRRKTGYAKSTRIAVRVLKGGVILMAKQRKDTPKRPRKPIKPSDVAVIITAFGTLLTGLAALINALT